MLRSLKALRGYTVLANDGDIGKVHDFYFHDDTWIIRYLVVDTGHWLPGRKVLLPPQVLGKPNWAGFTFPVALNREQVEKSPDIDTDQPVSRRQELDLHTHFGWPMYWIDPGTGAWPAMMPMTPVFDAAETPESAAKEKADTRLRSAKEVIGYHIHATDGELGHVDDFITDDANWLIRYMVVATRKWISGKQVLISPQWLKKINHFGGKVDVSLTREQIQHCPEFFPGAPVNREYEERLYDYYGRPTYWEEDAHAAKSAK